jgi:ATP-dependent Clp protease ATP-binding subunit ClpB
MKSDAFTHRAQDALRAAHELAREKGHPELLPEHVLAALLDQDDGVAAPILAKLDADVATLKNRLQFVLDRMPTVSGAGEPALSGRANRMLLEAQKEAKALRDEYVSVEHLLLALAKEADVDRARLLAAIREFRGAQRVDSADAEGKYRVLEKFTNDLTAMAEKGRLDPVIGRDDEIRRVMQILSRRTKNNPVLIGEPAWGRRPSSRASRGASSRGTCPRA